MLSLYGGEDLRYPNLEGKLGAQVYNPLPLLLSLVSNSLLLVLVSAVSRLLDISLYSRTETLSNVSLSLALRSHTIRLWAFKYCCCCLVFGI